MNQEENQALLALYELESHVCPHLDNINQTDPAVQYCMEQAKFTRYAVLSPVKSRYFRAC